MKENQLKIEAIQEGKRVSAYFESEEEIQEFVHQINEFKEFEKLSLGWQNLDKNDTIQKETNIIPSRSEIS
jgi:cell fate (sporulation/competence/biofilm development) regulator YmcA (YheA/YmcA/DUF963 family)